MRIGKLEIEFYKNSKWLLVGLDLPLCKCKVVTIGPLEFVWMGVYCVCDAMRARARRAKIMAYLDERRDRQAQRQFQSRHWQFPKYLG